MVAGDHFNFPSGGFATIVLGGHLRGEHRTRSLIVDRDAGHIIEHADSNGCARRLSMDGADEQQCESAGKQRCVSSSSSPLAQLIRAVGLHGVLAHTASSTHPRIDCLKLSP